MRRSFLPLAAAALAAGSLARCTSSGSSPPPGETDAGYTVIVGRDGVAFQPDGIPDGIDGGLFTVPVGQPVHWRFATSGFNVVSGTVGDGGCVPDNQFCSGIDPDGGVVDCSQAPLQTASTRWTYTFADAGTYTYFSSPQCVAGVVTVE
jgi:plastocyanin